jgi:hypothetical protein
VEQLPARAANAPSSRARPHGVVLRACVRYWPGVGQSRAPQADSTLPNRCRPRKPSARTPRSVTQVQVFSRFPCLPIIAATFCKPSADACISRGSLRNSGGSVWDTVHPYRFYRNEICLGWSCRQHEQQGPCGRCGP